MSILFNKRIQTDKDVSPPILSFTSIVQDTIIDYGGSGTLNSTAQAINPSTKTAASGTISYQWYKNGSPISGANSATLTLTNQLTAADYYCVASFVRSGTTAPAINSPITSRTARTTIRNNIVITKQPQNQSVVIGKTATFVCSAYPNPKSMSGFNPNLYGGSGFGDADYNAAISQGFSNADIRYYLENVWTGRIGPNMISRLNDSNFGTEQSKNLVYDWYVNGALTKTTKGNITSQISGFNGQGIYLDLSDYVGKVLVEFNVTQNSQNYNRIYIPELGTINNGVNARFLNNGYLEENLPGTSTSWGNHNLLLDGGRIYGPITSNTLGSVGYLAVAGEVGTGGYDRLDMNDSGGSVDQADDFRVSINKGFFKTYVDPADSGTLTLTKGGVTFNVNQPSRVKQFSTLDLSSSIIASSSVYCKIRQENVSGDLAPPPINSNTVFWTVASSQCLGWDDSRKPGEQVKVVTQSGIKSGTTWYGPWIIGTNDDTCYIYLDLEVRDIHPRAINQGIAKPFIVIFQLRVRADSGSGNEDYKAYKILEWNATSATDNERNKQTLRFGSGDFDGQQVTYRAKNGSIIFNGTNSSSPSVRAPWTGLRKPAIDILWLGEKYQEDGSNMNAFLQVDSTRSDNILEYGRSFDPYQDVY